MKLRLYLILTISLLPFSSNGQTTYFTGHVGSQTTLVNRNYNASRFSGYSNPGYNIGAAIKKIDSMGFYTEFGIQMVQKSTAVEFRTLNLFSSFFSGNTTNYTFQYIGIPLMAGFRKGNKYYTDFCFGIVAEYLTLAQTSDFRVVRSSGFFSEFEEVRTSIHKDAFPFQLGYVLRLGVGRYFHDHFFVELRTSLQGNTTAALKGRKYENFKLVNPGFQLALGYDLFE
jgi:hypothetical protein